MYTFPVAVGVVPRADPKSQCPFSTRLRVLKLYRTKPGEPQLFPPMSTLLFFHDQMKPNHQILPCIEMTYVLPNYEKNCWFCRKAFAQYTKPALVNLCYRA